MKFIKEIKTTLLMMAGFYMVIGLSMLIEPEFISNIICYIIGAFCLIMGGLAIYTYICSEAYGPLGVSFLILSIIFISLGLFIVFNPVAFASFIPLVMGLLLVIESFCKMQSSFTLKKYNYDAWYQVLIVSIIVFILGIVLIVSPFKTAILLIRILGLILVIDGISSIVTAGSYSQIEKAIKE